jgi:hypothetical protein
MPWGSRLAGAIGAIEAIWLALAAPALAQEAVYYSPDTTVVLSGTVTGGEDVVGDDRLGSVVLQNLGVIPAGAEVDAYGFVPPSDHFFSLDVTAELSGGLIVEPGDVVHWSCSYDLTFDASGMGLPAGINVDAFTFTGGDHVVSFDTTALLPGSITADDEDLVRRLPGDDFAIFFDGSAEGIPANLDLDGAHLDEATGILLLSFDASSQIAAIDFDDEDVLRFDPQGASWSLYFDGDSEHADLAAGDLVAVPEPSEPLILAAGMALLLVLSRWRQRGRSYAASSALLLLIAAFVASPVTAQPVGLPPSPFHLAYEEMTDWLASKPSTVVTVVSFGTSTYHGPCDTVQGFCENQGTQACSQDADCPAHPLQAIKISDNPTVDEDEPVFLFTGVIHGREPIGARILLELAEDLIDGYLPGTEVETWVDEFQIWLVPVMNPHGYADQLRKTGPHVTNECPGGPIQSQGVNLNANFALRWDRCEYNKLVCSNDFSKKCSSDSDCPTGGTCQRDQRCLDPSDGNYRGPCKMSAPESVAMAELVRELQPLVGVTYHSGQGDAVGSYLYPWSIGDLESAAAGINTQDCVQVSDPPDILAGADLARAYKAAVHTSRVAGRLCSGAATIPSACPVLFIGRLGSVGASSAWFHSEVGMFDLLVETNGDLNADNEFDLSEAWRDSYFYQEDPQLTPGSTEQIHLDDGWEYVRNNVDGIKALFRYMQPSCQTTGVWAGAFVTGRVLDSRGDPVVAEVEVSQMGGGTWDRLHVDESDADCDGVPEAPYCPAADLVCPDGGSSCLPSEKVCPPDSPFRRSNRSYGRYHRLLAEGDWELTFTDPAGLLQPKTVSVPVSDSCRENVPDVVLLDVPLTAGSIDVSQARVDAGGGFPFTISEAGSYRLTSNLTVTSASTPAIVVNADGVDLDLNGFTVRGPVSCTGGQGSSVSCPGQSPAGVGISSSADQVVVRNGIVHGVGGSGLELTGEGVRVEGVIALENGGDGFDVGNGALLTKCLAVRNGGRGFALGSASSLTASSASDNGSNGVAASFGVTITGNASQGNASTGIGASRGSTIANNAVHGNGGTGVSCTVGCTVHGNAISSNGNIGLTLQSTSGYKNNVIHSHATEPVSGGVNVSPNLCDGSTVAAACDPP